MFRRSNREKLGTWARTKQDTRRYLLSGLLIVVPMGITVLVVRFLYRMTAGFLTPIIEKIGGRLPEYLIPTISVLIFLGCLYIIGLVATAMVGRRLIALGESIIQHIPFIKSIYATSKQVVKAVSMQDGFSGFKSAVFVEFPHPDMWAIGFLTGTITVEGVGTYCRVFIPTTPNVTTGFFELVKPEKVFQSQLSVEDAAKMLMSGGIIGPDAPLTLTPTVIHPTAPETQPTSPTDNE